MDAKDLEIAQLKQYIIDYKAILYQTKRHIKSRVNGKLQIQIAPLLQDIHSAASMLPARIHVILDRVETIQSIIKQEVEWLEKDE